MRNTKNRRTFRDLAFDLQTATTANKGIILINMIRLMETEEDKEELVEMYRTITTNIIQHDIVIGAYFYGDNKYNLASALAANS